MNADAGTAPAPQHMQALERANAVRLARADLKRRVAEGELSAAEVVMGVPWEASSMTISELLTSQRRWGHTRCRKFLQSIPMSEHKTIGSMTDRQRQAVARQLRAGSPTPIRRRAATRGCSACWRWSERTMAARAGGGDAVPGSGRRASRAPRRGWRSRPRGRRDRARRSSAGRCGRRRRCTAPRASAGSHATRRARRPS